MVPFVRVNYPFLAHISSRRRSTKTWAVNRGAKFLVLQNLGKRRMDFRDAFKKVCPSVVGIGYQNDGVLEILGTGFLVSQDGWLITNRHVITEPVEGGCKFREDVKVFLFPESDVLVLNVCEYNIFPSPHVNSPKPNFSPSTHQIVKNAIGDYTPELHDISYLKIDPPLGYNLNPVLIGETANLSVGTYVGVIGFPQGLQIPPPIDATLELTPTFQIGTIAALLPSPSFREIERYALDLFVNTGSSGSPVFLSDGNVIGIIMQTREVKAYLLTYKGKLTSTSVPERKETGLGYAIPQARFPENDHESRTKVENINPKR
ncbi:MAG: serine protease [Terriglobia bacterium]